MKYTNFCSEKISLLGFGGMRLPTNTKGKIDYEQANEMVDVAIKNGINYFDTAFMYHGGESETFYGDVLTKYPRDSYYLADKMPSGYPGSLEEIFETQLGRTKADYFDFYLLHSITYGNFESFFEKNNAIDFVLQKKKEGRIKHVGFSFHGNADLLEKVLTKYDCFEFVQIQLNYYDAFDNDALELYNIAKSHGLPIIVMEPVRGGLLAKLSQGSAKLLTDRDPDLSLASWAIRYVFGLEGIMCVLSGMSDMSQLKDNLKNVELPSLTAEDQDAIKAAYEAFKSETFLPCTGCRYCADCPQGIDIAQLFKHYNNYGIESPWVQAGMIAKYKKFEKKASDCIECGMCVKRCPQGLNVPELLKKVKGTFEK